MNYDSFTWILIILIKSATSCRNIGTPQKRLHDLAKTSWSFTGRSDRKMTIGYWSRWYQSYSLLRSYSILFIQKSPTVSAGNFLKFIALPSTLSDGRGSRISHMKSTGDRFTIKKSCPTFCQQLCICFPWINHILPANVFSIHLHLSLRQYLFMAFMVYITL